INKWCTHGLVTAPRIKVAAVMPSCAPASMIVSSFKERKPAREAREVSAVSSKRLRRALIKENSIMTKNAEVMITSRVTTRLIIQLSISGPALHRQANLPSYDHQFSLIRSWFLQLTQWLEQMERGGRFLPRAPSGDVAEHRLQPNLRALPQGQWCAFRPLRPRHRFAR